MGCMGGSKILLWAVQDKFFHIKVKCDSSGLNCPMDRVLEINIIHLVGSILGKTCSLIICYFTWK